MKLTKEMKGAIITKAMKGYKAAEKAAIEERRAAFGIEVYEHKYGAAEPVVMKLDPEWRDMHAHFHLGCEGFQTKIASWDAKLQQTVYSQGDPEELSDRMELGKERAFPGSSYGTPDIEIDDKHPLYKKARALVRDHLKIAKQEAELREKMAALLASCNTDKQLEAAWPEGMQFLPQGVSTSTALVPVGLSDQINKALGIPSAASVGTTAVRKAASTT